MSMSVPTYGEALDRAVAQAKAGPETPLKVRLGHVLDDANIAKIRGALALLDDVKDLDGRQIIGIGSTSDWLRFVARCEAERWARGHGWTCQEGPDGPVWSDEKGAVQVAAGSYRSSHGFWRAGNLLSWKCDRDGVTVLS